MVGYRACLLSVGLAASFQHCAIGESNAVRVAAIQCYSRMGDVEYNRKLLSGLIEKAAGNGARIVVVPECAISGYMDPANDVKWSTNRVVNAGELDADKVAEPIPGASTEYFGKMSKRLQIYLCIALAEKDGGRLYNTQVLLDPDGKIAGHHRKKHLWTPGDGLWASEGDKPVQVVDTKYGKLGMMICYEYQVLPKLLAEKGADIVLYSVGWYAPNADNWFKGLFPRDIVIPNNFAVVVANWSAEEVSQGWPGHGYSCIIDRDGKVLAIAKETQGEEIVMADLPITKKRKKEQ